jgi:hypothetical protein
MVQDHDWFEERKTQVCKHVHFSYFMYLLFHPPRRIPSDSDDEHPLPIQTYATLKDRQIKEMLHQYDLPVNGNRTIWEHRHQRYALFPCLTTNRCFLSLCSSWVMLHNSNLDRSLSNRKSKAELRKDLKKWEDEMSKKKKPVIGDVLDYQARYGSFRLRARFHLLEAIDSAQI